MVTKQIGIGDGVRGDTDWYRRLCGVDRTMLRSSYMPSRSLLIDVRMRRVLKLPDTVVCSRTVVRGVEGRMARCLVRRCSLTHGSPSILLHFPARTENSTRPRFGFDGGGEGRALLCPPHSPSIPLYALLYCCILSFDGGEEGVILGRVLLCLLTPLDTRYYRILSFDGGAEGMVLRGLVLWCPLTSSQYCRIRSFR